MNRDVEVSIEVLSLLDFGRLDERAMRSGIEAELGRLLTERGLPHGWTGDATTRSLDAGSFAWDGTGTDRLAASIALHLYEGLAR